MRRYEFITALFLIFPALFSTGCAGDADSMASDWDSGPVPIDYYAFCCDQRCDDFLLFEGNIEHGIPTWHELDSGLGLVGEHVVLSTTDEHAGPSDMTPDCYQVTVLADKDPDAALWLEVDVFGDGENVAVKNIPADNWSTSKFVFKAPHEEGTMSFSLVKEGDARAVLYFIEVDGMFDCGASGEEVDP